MILRHLRLLDQCPTLICLRNLIEARDTMILCCAGGPQGQRRASKAARSRAENSAGSRADFVPQL